MYGLSRGFGNVEGGIGFETVFGGVSVARNRRQHVGGVIGHLDRLDRVMGG